MNRHLRALADHLLPRLAPSKPPTEGGVPEARPLPEIPRPRDPEDRIHRVGLCAALRASSEDAIDDWREWQGEVDETHVIPRLMTVMETKDRAGEGW